MAARSAREFAEQLKTKSIPLVAVPYMGEVGQRLCKEAEVCWLDLSGNAHLSGPGLRVNIEGKPNQFKRPGPSAQFVCAKKLADRAMAVNRTRTRIQPARTGQDERYWK